MIVGLSQEMGQRAQLLKNFIETRDGLDWPNGYGADLAYEIRNHGSTHPKVTGQNCRYALAKQLGRSTPWDDTVRTMPQYFHDTVALQIVRHN